MTQQTMPSQTAAKPNFYTLSNRKTSITYLRANEAAHTPPKFEYQGIHGKHTFGKDSIRSVVSDLGELVSVTVETGIDEATSLTLLLPEMNVVPDQEQNVDTVAIETKHYAGFLVPMPGILETFQRAEFLHGTAKLQPGM